MQGVDSSLRIARFQDRTQALGPGERAVIWFQGCSFNCPGCIAAEMNRSDDFERTSPSELADRVLSIRGIEGVTLSGGDPFDQPLDALAQFLDVLKQRGGLSVMCYTGRTLEQLRRCNESGDAITKILAALDILIDGLYVESLNDGSSWRGSSNQILHFLSSRYRHLEFVVSEERERKLEVTIGPAGAIDFTGIPPAGFIDRLQIQLKLRGLQLDSEDSYANHSGIIS